MGEIKDFLTLYIDEEVAPLKEYAQVISADLEENIKSNIKPGPGITGYDTGQLHDSIHARPTIHSKRLATITAWYGPDYGKYVIAGVRGKAEVKEIDFMNNGLEATVANYR